MCDSGCRGGVSSCGNNPPKYSSRQTQGCQERTRGPRGEQGPPGQRGPRGEQGLTGIPGPPGVLDIRTLTHRRSNGSSLPFPRRPIDCDHVDLPTELLNEPFTLEDNGKRLHKTWRVEREKFHFQIDRATGIKFNIGDRSYSVLTEVNMLFQKAETNVSAVTIYDAYGLSITYEFLKHLHEVKGRHQFWNPAWIAGYLDASLMVLRPDIKIDLVTISCLDDIANKSSYLLTELTYLDSLEPKTTEALVHSDLVLPSEVLALISNNPSLNRSIAESVHQARS